jgi:alkylated DNA nucleotide flippase Atl1
MSSPIPTLGPARTGTLVCNAFDKTVAAYVDHLSMSVAESGAISQAQADLWGAPRLVGNRYAVLQSETSIAWIRVVEDTETAAAITFKQQGWMSLEVVVADVNRLAEELVGSDFELFRPPADLDISDAIRAMQVIGPAGEVLYLTQVNGTVEPFDIPMAKCRVDHLFIPVMCCTDRDEALTFYQQFPGGKDFSFDTKITSVNEAYGYDLDRKHPVATAQLAGSTMIEIDQIEAAEPRPQGEGLLPAGIAMISYEVESLADLKIDWFSVPAKLEGAPYNGRLAACCRGKGGEIIELIERV